MAISEHLVSKLKDPELATDNVPVAGEWLDSSDATRTFDVFNPSTGALIGKRCFTGTSPDKRYPSKLEMMVVSSSILANVTSAAYG